ncbi:MAG: YcjX family protein [Azospirillum sp.]|nr:YcjX family protein [Azospirillum sp.]
MSNAGEWAFDRVSDLVGNLTETNLRLGVTGLRRAGKTVFVTSLIDNLLKAGRLPFLDVVASNRYQAARLRPHPDVTVPRFDYERHLAAITGTQPGWPEPTRGLQQIRVSIRFVPGSTLRRTVQPLSTLNLDIVDYPGEWLLDLPLMELPYGVWSQGVLDLAERPPRAALAAAWRHWLGTVSADLRADEAQLREGARLYTDYLHACRRSSANLSVVQPGRFVEPGDLAGAPLLTFCPLPDTGREHRRESLWALMEQRFEAYKSEVVRRFFVEHFSRLNRQIVLVDLLGALTAGPGSLDDMRSALVASLQAFRHGRSGWLERLIGGRIDRVLFAATKADHVAASQHGNLCNLLDLLLSDARRAMRFEGAQVGTVALAALKCTETVKTEHQGRQLSCVQGTPVGRDKPTVLYPGEIPDSLDLFPDEAARPYTFLDFLPPTGAGRDGRGLPNIRLDQALNHLLGDYFA